MMILFDDQFRSDHIPVSTVNISKNVKRRVNCTDMAFDSRSYDTFVLCHELGQLQAIVVVLITLERDVNSIVNAMYYIRPLFIDSLPVCQQRKILFLDDVYVGDEVVYKEVMVYCSENLSGKRIPKAVRFNASLLNTSITNFNFSKCPDDCCYAS